MLTMGVNTWNAIANAGSAIPSGAIIGGVLGYSYAKFAHLPASQVAKGWAIWFAASNVFSLLITDRFEKNNQKIIGRAFAINISTVAGIQQLQQRGLIGGKMCAFFTASALFFTIFATTFVVFKPLFKSFCNTVLDSMDDELQIRMNSLKKDKAEDQEKIKHLENTKISISKIRMFIDSKFTD